MSIQTENSNYSKWTAIIVILIIGYFVFNNGFPFIMSWDLFGHHSYLPLLFEHKSMVVDISYFERIQATYNNTPTLYQYVPLPDGNVMIKYTSGWALLMLPFYAIAEIWAGAGGFATDGFSFPYQTMIAIGAFTYFVLSVFLLRKLLLKFFEDKVVAMTILFVFFGTNFFFMQYASLGTSHNLEFFLITLMLLLTLRFHEKITLKNGVFLGLVIGLIALVRPPDVILSLIPIAWKSNAYGGLIGKLKYFFKNHLKIVLLTVLMVILAFAPQIIYWKISAGSLLMNSYANNPGEGFDWFTPYLLNVLFSFKKGWLLYTPIMFFALFGFYHWYKKDSQQGKIAIIVFLVFLYVVSCWTTWWYAESYSQRSMVDIYPLLSIAFGFFIAYAIKSKVKVFYFGVLLLLTGLNLFQTYQIQHGIIHGARMTKAYYFSTFGQKDAPSEAQLQLLSVDRDELEKYPISENDFKKVYEKDYIFDDFILSEKEPYTPIIDISPEQITSKEYFWLRATWKYDGTIAQLDGKIFTGMGMYKGQGYRWRGSNISQENFKLDTIRKEVVFEYISPHFRKQSDVIRLGVWNQYGTGIKILGVRIEGFEPK